jgi:cell wall-associated NlpC family hydrolase
VLAALIAAGCGEDPQASSTPLRASIEGWRWAPSSELPQREERERPAKPKVERAAEEPVAPQQLPQAAPQETPPELAPLPGSPESADQALVRAEVLDNGVALPPLEAPPAVKAIFEAGNTIARSPYKWGGGHGKWRDSGYDCSGSVSYALAAAGLLDGPLASGPLMHWGKPGKGEWITIYTNPGHVFMVVAGVRFDTVARGRTGSRWINTMTDTSGYVARHPQGL